MTSVDELFKNSGLPSKRKLDPVRDPNEIYKSAKLSPNGHSNRNARVDDEPQQEDDDDPDAEAGPARPPPEDGQDDDGDYGPSRADADDNPEDDEEGGRFFGGGISRQEADVLDYLDNDDDDAAPAEEKIDSSWLRRAALSLEKRINRNAELRARYESQPSRFIDSEAELDAEVRALSILSDHPALYPELAGLGTAASLASLLAHDNTDVAISAAQIVGELTADDVVGATEEQWGALADALLEADVVGLLVGNLRRLDEADEADRAGVYYALGVVENLCSRAATAEQIGRDDSLLRWLLERIQREEKVVSQNKQYAAEILAILAQSAPANRARLAGGLEGVDPVDAMLQLVAPYRKRDPDKGAGEEEEYVADLFEALTCIVDDATGAGKAKFVEAEGVELCLIMLKEGKSSRLMALRLLDHAVSGGTGALGAAADVCKQVVEAGGLKTLFTAFMSKKHQQQQQGEGQVVEHLVGIFAWMLRLLPADSAERIRTLAKFVEREYEKTGRLVALRRRYAERVGAVDQQIEAERQALEQEDREAMADEWFSRRLDAGLFCLQTIDVILSWLIAEDDGARRKIHSLLTDQDESFETLRKSIQEQLDGIDTEDEGGKETKEMLSTLVEFLQ